MKTPRILNAMEYIDDDLIICAESEKKFISNLLFKRRSFVACFIIFAVLCVTTISNLFAWDSEHMGKYKKISLRSEALAGEEAFENPIDKKTRVVSNVSKQDFPSKMKVYKIVPRKITKDFFKSLALSLGMTGEVRTDASRFEYYVGAQENKFPYDDTRIEYVDGKISYSNNLKYDNSIADTDEELIEKAKAVFNSLNLEDEYECVGIASVWTLYDGDEQYSPVKRVAFRRIVDGYRVIGNDICDIYMCSEGVYGIELRLFDYIEDGEIELKSMKNIISKVKSPDAFSFDTETSKNYSGVADTLTINKTKLLLVNQYDNECEILEPVYNLMGVAENKEGSIEFSSKIIAIPDKYIS